MSEQLILDDITKQTCFVPATHKGKGRYNAVAPDKAASRYLYYGRIILENGDSAIAFENETHETGFICLNGAAKVWVGDKSFELNRYDSIYIPRDSKITVETNGENCDLAEISAPVENHYPLQFVAYSDVRKNPTLSMIAGKQPSERNLNVLLGANIEAGRIMAGVTFSTPGNWTSFPPHEHAQMLEEAYLYIDMPAPAWGVQFVYLDKENPELVQVVREGDVVLMPQGYHPNVAAPGGQINFLWMMAAVREVEDRQFGVVNVHPDYASQNSGLEAAVVK